ncbi:MAG: HEAT repeat domain-containing protein [Armatimonadota bacterium]|nr:HEAT repeat domain-containing protein [bacterium]
MQNDQPADRPLMTSIDDADSCIAKLSDPDPCVIAEGAFGLSWHGDSRNNARLLPLLEHNDECVRWAAIMGLANVVTGHVEEALVNLCASDPVARVRAASVSRLAHGSKKAMAAIATAADDPYPEVRIQVAMAFIWRRCRLGTRVLRRMLTDPIWKVRWAACSVLLQHKIIDARVINAVEQLSQEPEAAQHDVNMLALREELHTRLRESEHLADIISGSRTTQEMLDYARELAATRRGLWGIIRS